MRRKWQVALLAASATTIIALIAGDTSAQTAYPAQCRPDRAYPVGSYCYRAARYAAEQDWGRTGWSTVGLSPTARAAMAWGASAGDQAAAGVYRPVGSYGGADNAYSGGVYPTREIYRRSYIPGSYYGPVCNPQFDPLCQ